LRGKEVIGRFPKFKVPKIAKMGVMTKLSEKAMVSSVITKEIVPRGNKITKKIMLR